MKFSGNKIKDIRANVMKESMNEVFLGLGGNIGQRFDVLREAVHQIQVEIGSVQKLSPLYETQAWGSNSKNLYLNQVIKIETNLDALSVLEIIGRIEKLFGRKRTASQNSDRTLDIDILLFNAEIIQEKTLQIPHPRMHLRNFVLYPICDIDEDLMHPLLLKTMAELKNTCIDQMEIKQTG